MEDHPLSNIQASPMEITAPNVAEAASVTATLSRGQLRKRKRKEMKKQKKSDQKESRKRRKLEQQNESHLGAPLSFDDLVQSSPSPLASHDLLLLSRSVFSRYG